MNILLVLAIFIVFIFLLGKFLIVYATKLTSIFIGDNHKNADEIISSGFVPLDWLVDTRGNKPRFRKGMNKSKALRRIAKVINYFRRTLMVESEEVRHHILSRLQAVEKHWRESEWEQIVPPNLLGMEDDRSAGA